MSDRRYLIVGGAGYFGSRLAEALAADAEVTITYRSETLSRKAWIQRTPLRALAFDSDADCQLPVSGRFDAVINLAMPGAVEAAEDEAAALTRAQGVAKACLSLLDRGAAARMIHLSSFHIYGASGREAFDETDAPAPVSPYGRIHLNIEGLVMQSSHVVTLRASNMVGAPAHSDLGDQARLVFLDLCRQAATGSTVSLNNDGLSHRDFLGFGDAIAALRLLLRHDLGSQRLFNLALGMSIRLDELAEIIRAAAGNVVLVKLGSGRDDFRSPFRIRIRRLEQLGWHPCGSLADEAAGTVRFFRETR